MNGWQWWQVLVIVYAAYALVTVVDIYCQRDTRPHDRRAHALVWGLALAWPPALVYLVTRKVRRRWQHRRLLKRSTFGRAFEEGARTKRADVERVIAQAIRDGRMAVNQLPPVDATRSPFSRHPDATYGGQERIYVCLDPECHCRDHRDVDPDHYPTQDPEDHWR